MTLMVIVNTNFEHLSAQVACCGPHCLELGIISISSLLMMKC